MAGGKAREAGPGGVLGRESGGSGPGAERDAAASRYRWAVLRLT